MKRFPFIKQKDSMQCGVACLASICEYYGKANSMLERYDKKLENMSSKLHQALTYMVKNWKELIGYVNVGNVQIDNNCCERAVRPFTNLRKIAVLFFPNGNFSTENFQAALAKFNGLKGTSQYKKFDLIYCIQGEDIVQIKKPS